MPSATSPKVQISWPTVLRTRSNRSKTPSKKFTLCYIHTTRTLPTR